MGTAAIIIGNILAIIGFIICFRIVNKSNTPELSDCVKDDVERYMTVLSVIAIFLMLLGLCLIML